MKTVNVYIICDGEIGEKTRENKGNQSLTKNGIEQVRLSAKKNFSDTTFDEFYYSGERSANETVKHANWALNSSNEIFAEPNFCFGYDGIFATGYLFTCQEDLRSLAKKTFLEMPTVKMWQIAAPEIVNPLRTRIRLGIFEVSLITIAEDRARKNEYNVLVGSHSPLAELGCIDMETMPKMRPADIVKYKVVFDGQDAKITESEFLSRGF